MTWATEPQQLFLEDVFAKNYHAAKKGGNAEVEALHEKTFEAYISRWPVETAQFSSAAVNSGTPQEIHQKKKSALQNVRQKPYYAYLEIFICVFLFVASS